MRNSKTKPSHISESELKDKVWEDIKNINKNLCNYKHIKNVIITNEPMIKTSTGKVKRKEEIENLYKKTIR